MREKLPTISRPRTIIITTVAAALGFLAATGTAAATSGHVAEPLQVIQICEELGSTQVDEFIKNRVVQTVLTISVTAGVLSGVLYMLSEPLAGLNMGGSLPQKKQLKRGALYGLGSPFIVYALAAMASILGVGDVSCLLPGV